MIVLKTTQNQLLSALQSVAGIVERRHTLPVLANVLRVLFIALLTYHQGNAVGQSFVHELSGLFLFVVALLLIIGLDGLLDRLGLACPREVTP